MIVLPILEGLPGHPERSSDCERSWEGEQEEVKPLFLHGKVFASISTWLAYKRTLWSFAQATVVPAPWLQAWALGGRFAM